MLRIRSGKLLHCFEQLGSLFAMFQEGKMAYLNSIFGVSGKVALVTGGATGIGRMIAEANLVEARLMTEVVGIDAS